MGITFTLHIAYSFINNTYMYMHNFVLAIQNSTLVYVMNSTPKRQSSQEYHSHSNNAYICRMSVLEPYPLQAKFLLSGQAKTVDIITSQFTHIQKCSLEMFSASIYKPNMMSIYMQSNANKLFTYNALACTCSPLSKIPRKCI